MSRRRMIALLLLSALALSVVLFLLRSPAPVGGQLRERGEMAAAIGGELAGAARVQLDILSAEDRAEVEEMLSKEVCDVERVTIDREIPAPVGPRQEGDVTIIPVVEEVLVVSKRYILREEIRVKRRTEQVLFRQEVELRRQTASVRRKELPE